MTTEQATQSQPAKEIDEKGFYIFQNVLTAAEIQELKRISREYFKTNGRAMDDGGKKVGNAPIEVPAINWLFTHPRVIDCFRQALGTNEIMFTGSAGIQLNALSAWHKDDGTGPDIPNYPGYFSVFPYGNNDCKVYRMAVYLQDHDRDKFGLWVREGSHRLKSVEEGAVRYTGVRAGSVVVFHASTTHAGQFKSRLQWRAERVSRLLGSAALGFKIRKLYRKLVRRERIAIFFSYGVANPHTIEFARVLMEKDRGKTGTDYSVPSALRAAGEKAGIQFAQDHFTLGANPGSAAPVVSKYSM